MNANKKFFDDLKGDIANTTTVELAVWHKHILHNPYRKAVSNRIMTMLEEEMNNRKAKAEDENKE